MKILERFYNWLSDVEPYEKLKLFKKCQKIEKMFDASNPDFLDWAFGDNKEGSLQQKMDYWNKHHKDLLIIEQIDHFYDQLPQMGAHWANSLINK